MIDQNDNNFANGHASLKDRVRELQLSNRLDGVKPAKSGSATAWLPWLLCFLMAVAWGGFGIRYYRNSVATATAPAADGAQSSKSTAMGGGKEVGAGEIVLESKGYLIPSHSIAVSPIDVAGRVTVLEIEEGKPFKEGDVLAKIDSTRYFADLKEAEAQLANAQAKLSEIETSTPHEIRQAECELAEARAQRDEALVVLETYKATVSGATAKLDIAQASKKLEAAAEHVKVLETKLSIVRDRPRQERIIAARRDLEAAQARLAKAKWSFDNCTILSPVTGIILTKKAEIGSLINPVVGGVSTSLCEIADLSQLEVDLEIQERDVAKLKINMVCRVRPDAYPSRTYDGFVERIMPIANRARGIIPVRVRVVFPHKDDPNEKQGTYLKPEMGVSVTFIQAIYQPKAELLPAPLDAAPKIPTAGPEAKR
jgi:HlyD family secretion protein